MNEKTKCDVLRLIRKVEEVMHNNDWPTEEGQMSADGPTCPLEVLLTEIKAGL